MLECCMCLEKHTSHRNKRFLKSSGLELFLFIRDTSIEHIKNQENKK